MKTHKTYIIWINFNLWENNQGNFKLERVFDKEKDYHQQFLIVQLEKKLKNRKPLKKYDR